MSSIRPSPPRPTGATRTIDGVKLHSWKVGILRYEWRTEDDRVHVGTNGLHRASYWSSVDGVALPTRFRSQDGAARAALKLLKHKIAQEPVKPKLAERKVHILTAARLRALEAVERGEVSNRFHATGNVFVVPPGISPQVCRGLQTDKLIEDAPTQGRYLTMFPQRLTQAARDAMALAKLPKVRERLHASEARCAYPACKCIVSTSSTQPEPVCPERTRTMNWQMYWRDWWKLWPSTSFCDYRPEYPFGERYFFFGPLQMSCWSKR